MIIKAESENVVKKRKELKCIIWDLDNTIWDGILSEDKDVKLKPGIIDIIKTLDARGILHSIASKNDYSDAINKIKELGINEYFLYPQINWNAKSSSIEKIQRELNIGMDSILFIDDQVFEIEEIRSVHPDINCIGANEYALLLDHPQLNPKYITVDSKRRRQMYLEDIQRRMEEDIYQGPKESFLASLNMEFIITKAKEEDLMRAEELTIRTNQLNATGKTYSYDELKFFIDSKKHKLLICELKDKYGSYGKIGLALLEMDEEYWYIRLILMSCRVISRGVGTVLMTYIMQEAKAGGKKIKADFKETGKNKMMNISYRFAGFKETYRDDEGNVIFINDLSQIQQIPYYINVKIGDCEMK